MALTYHIICYTLVLAYTIARCTTGGSRQGRSATWNTPALWYIPDNAVATSISQPHSSLLNLGYSKLY